MAEPQVAQGGGSAAATTTTVVAVPVGGETDEEAGAAAPAPPPDSQHPHGVDSPQIKRKRQDEEAAEPEQGASPASGDDAADKSKAGELGAPGEQPPRHPLWKTSLCSYFRRRTASCSHGDACRYAHSEEELRPRPDNTWDPNSQRAKRLKNADGKANAAAGCDSLAAVDEAVDGLGCSDGGGNSTALDKCLIGLPMKWSTDNLNNFLQSQAIPYKTAKKKKGMTVGFIGFTDLEQVKSATQELNGKSISGKHIELAEVNRRFKEKLSSAPSNDQRDLLSSDSQSNKDPSDPTNLLDSDAIEEDNYLAQGYIAKARTARDVVTPLADMSYSDQLEHKKNSLLQTLKRLTRNARKACPNDVALPEWIFKARDIGGLPCKLEGILESPLTSGYRNKCEFSVGFSPQGKKTVGFMLGNFREGMTAVMEPIDCPNVSYISCKYASIFQEFLQSSNLPVWNRIDNVGFWRQFTVREGRKLHQAAVFDDVTADITEVMLIVQVCTAGINNNVIDSEFKKMSEALVRGASECSPPLPLTSLVVQDHKGISNAAPADCPLLPLPIPNVGNTLALENEGSCEARIHDYINNLRFSISPTAFFQVNTLAAEKLYSLAGDWANLSSDALLFDVCCGTGTIGLTLAHRVGMVVGIEMNNSAVSDAQRNAEINGIKNCRFICGKAEDVMGALLKEYLDVPLEVCSNSEINEEVKSNSGNLQVAVARGLDLDVCSNHRGDSMYQNQQNSGGASISSEILEKQSDNDSRLNCVTGDEKEAIAVSVRQFRNVVAIVDPPRGGLHPNVIKTLRTHPRLRHLVYISCNPESLVANAIELCTPTSEEPQKEVVSRGWRNATSASLARRRAKYMPNSEPFRPVKAMAVDLFPHTPHCEMVMLLER